MGNPNPKTEYLKKFKKGQSGNPAGRPPGQGITDILRHWLSREIKVDDPFDKTQKIKMTLKESLALALFAKGRKGSEKAIEMILDRLDGKVAQPMKITGPAGGIININNAPDLSKVDPEVLSEYVRQNIQYKQKLNLEPLKIDPEPK